jgi:transcriptional regulator with XRE-family HTH domain
VDAASMLREARLRAGLTQRRLAQLANVPQPAISRIERRHVSPRLDTLDELLRAAGFGLDVVERPGRGVDRTLIRDRLRLSVAQRARLAAREWNRTGRFRARATRR